MRIFSRKYRGTVFAKQRQTKKNCGAPRGGRGLFLLAGPGRNPGGEDEGFLVPGGDF